MDRIEAYKKFLEGWGYDAQALMTIEEMSELTKALCKYKRYGKESGDPKLKEDIIEEIADVLNMAEQMAYYFGADTVEKVRDEKIERSLKRLEKTNK